MRIVTMPGSPSFPPLEAPLSMEKSWALQVEREEENLCLQGIENLPNRNSDCLLQTENSWDSCKQLDTGSSKRSHKSCEREYHLCSRASRYIDSKSDRNDKHSDSIQHSEKTSRPWWYKSSSRCYPPSSLVRCSDSSFLDEQESSQLQNQRALHESRRSERRRRTDHFSLHRRHSIELKDGVFRTVKAVMHSQNTGKRRQNHFACLNGKAEMTVNYEYSMRREANGDELHQSQDYQESEEYKHKYRRSQNMHIRDRDFVKSGFPECKSRLWQHAKQRGHHDNWQGVDERKKGAKCRRTSDSGMGQHEKSVYAELSFKEKPGVENDEHAIAEAVINTENASTEVPNNLDSIYVKELDSINDDLMARKQYVMLASFLSDDLHDMNQTVDATLVAGDGPHYDSSGSVFEDDDLNTSMDICVLTEQKKAVSGKILTECTTKHHDINLRQASEVKSSANCHAMKSPTARSPSCQKQFPSVLVDVTNKFEIHASPGVKGEMQENDPHRLSQRQRQIEFGKNTLGYERYIELIPRIKRKAKDPQTPNPKQLCSKRSWDGQIRKWRRLLHVYDPPSEDGEELAEDFSILQLRRANLEGKCHDAEEDRSTCIGHAEADKTKSSIVVSSRALVDDSDLSIYDDWMEL